MSAMRRVIEEVLGRLPVPIYVDIIVHYRPVGKDKDLLDVVQHVLFRKDTPQNIALELAELVKAYTEDLPVSSVAKHTRYEEDEHSSMKEQPHEEEEEDMGVGHEPQHEEEEEEEEEDGDAAPLVRETRIVQFVSNVIVPHFWYYPLSETYMAQGFTARTVVMYKGLPLTVDAEQVAGEVGTKDEGKPCWVIKMEYMNQHVRSNRRSSSYVKVHQLIDYCFYELGIERSEVDYGVGGSASLCTFMIHALKSDFVQKEFDRVCSTIL